MKKIIQYILLFSLLIGYIPKHVQASDNGLAGKKISILGASISTYNGISNNSSYNSTISKNHIYYPKSNIDVDLEDTWWMQVINDLDLELVVNNSWSGSSLLHTRNNTVGAYVNRCLQLHNNEGVEPDIIAIQIGYNDFQYYKDSLGTSDIDYDELIVENNGSYTYGVPTTTLEAAAIMLHKISVRYPNAEVYYLNVSDFVSLDENSERILVNFNKHLEIVCDYFGVNVVDIYNAIPKDSFNDYIGDNKVHPNSLGMDAYTEAFKKEVIENSKYVNEEYYTVNFDLDKVSVNYGVNKLVRKGDLFTIELNVDDGYELDVQVLMNNVDITSSCVDDHVININSIQGNVDIIAKGTNHIYKDYEWKFENGELVNVDNTNHLNKLGGTNENGVFNKTYYELKKSVILNHENEWVIEWRSKGDFDNFSTATGGRLLSSTSTSAMNSYSLFVSSKGLISMGIKTSTGSYNYGISLVDYDIDMNEWHTYRLENRVTSKGNMVYLIVDGYELGKLNNLFVGTTNQNQTDEWLNGKDFDFPYIGTDHHTINHCEIEYLRISELGYVHAVPESQGVLNVIKRARQLTDIEWTPLTDLHGFRKVDGVNTYYPFEAGKKQRGIPYSGVISYDTYVGLNVSLDTFMSALQDENSLLYTKNIWLDGYNKAATYYGTVCSKFAQYALNIPGSYNTANVPNIEGLDTIAMPGKYTVYDLKLGDIIVDTSEHTAVVTDIIYNQKGEIIYVEVSEAVFPKVRRKQWTAEEFPTKWKSYRLCRYQYIDETPFEESEYISVDEEIMMKQQPKFALMPTQGNKYNYKVSNKQGSVNILDNSYSKAIVERDGVIVQEINLNENTKSFNFSLKTPGDLEMYLIDENGNRSTSVYASVVSSSIKITNTESFLKGEIDVEFEGTSGKPIYVQLGATGGPVFCALDENETSSATITFEPSKVTTYRARVAYENDNAIYLSDWISFSVNLENGTGPNENEDELISQAILWEGYTLTPSSSMPTKQDDKLDYWTYMYIPVQPNTTYISSGGNRMWYYDQNKQPILTKNIYKEEPRNEFTTTENTYYVSITYSSTSQEGIGKETLKVKENDVIEPIIPIFPSLQEGEYYDGMTLTPSNSTPIVAANKENSWTHHLVPVEPNTTYIAVGGNRMWYYDQNKQPILTTNILQTEPKYEFTTTSKTYYVSITYSPASIEKGTEVLVKKKSLGDVNGDGEVNALDRSILARYIAKWSGYENINEVHADINLDGIVNQKDRLILARHLSKWQGYEQLPYIK